MARKHGKGTFVSVDGNDMSNYIASSDFNRAVDTSDTTAYGMDDREYLQGLRDATFSGDGHYDDDGTTGPNVIFPPLLGAAAVTVLRQVEGTGTGLPQESFSGILTSYDQSSPVDGHVQFSFEFQVTGAVDTTDQA